jgi:acetamidase/formamidase
VVVGSSRLVDTGAINRYHEEVATIMTEHVMEATATHHQWDASLQPALQINSGDIVHFDLKMAGHQQIQRDMPFAQTTLDFTTLYHLQGPIHVAGAHVGDTLAVEVLDLQPGDWGWCGTLPGLGLLPEFGDSPCLRYFDLTDGSTTEFRPGIHVPIRPFLGVMGTLPDDVATASPFPPHRGGGNIDNRHLIQGSTVLLPVFRDGGLFSCGDPHAAQGDGEVCVNALECDMTASLRFSLLDTTVTSPCFTVPGPDPAHGDDAGYYGTMGISSDLMEGARIAVRSMIELLDREHDLAPLDAYMLCSLAGQLRIFEIVDADVWNVGMTLARSLFDGAN